MLLKGQIRWDPKMSPGFSNVQANDRLRKSCLCIYRGPESRPKCVEEWVGDLSRERTSIDNFTKKLGCEEWTEKPMAVGQGCGKGAWQKDASAGWNPGRLCTQGINCGLNEGVLFSVWSVSFLQFICLEGTLSDSYESVLCVSSSYARGGCESMGLFQKERDL